MDFEKPTAVGPWGGQSGSYWDDGVHSSVRQIVIRHGAGVDSIQFEYDKQGSPVWSNKRGGTGGYKTDKVKLDYPEEFLTSINGYYGHLYDGGPVCVRSLTFVSNLQTHGPFGVEQGTFFSVPKVRHKVVSFYGRCGWFLDSIGVYLRPVEQKNALKPRTGTQTSDPKGTDYSGYSIIHGSRGKDYDILPAVKQKENLGDTPSMVRTNCTDFSPMTSSKGTSHSDSSSDEEGKAKALALPSPTDKKVPTNKDLVTIGPWGGSGGTLFDDGAHTGIKQIMLSRNIGIVYLKVLYDKNGQDVWGSRNGGTGGYKRDRIIFDYPDEILTYVTGFYGTTMISSAIVKSLTFHTTKGKYGPFGDEHGLPFSTKLKEGMVVGFHGRKGMFLDAIGVHVQEGTVIPQVRPPLPLLGDPITANGQNPFWPSKQTGAKGVEFEQPIYKVIKEPAPAGPGPWGGDGGKPWDDGVYTGIKQIFLTRSEVVCSIQIEYDRNKQSVWSVKHGGDLGTKEHLIKLDYPHEVLTCISGYYDAIGKDGHSKVIKSLTFYTCRGKYGPFGEELGTYFTSTTTEGKIVGFHGRSGWYLDAIGVHMQHWLGNSEQTYSSSFFRMFV